MQYLSLSLKTFCGLSSTLQHIPLNMRSKVKKIMKKLLKLWIPSILFEMICFVVFRNGHFRNVVSTFTNLVKLEVENDNVASTLSNIVHINVEIHNVDSTLFEVVNSNVEIHNVVSTLIWRCPTSRRCINQKATLKQRWNVCWV